jgi:hypothetical protein
MRGETECWVSMRPKATWLILPNASAHLVEALVEVVIAGLRGQTEGGHRRVGSRARPGLGNPSNLVVALVGRPREVWSHPPLLWRVVVVFEPKMP